MRIPTIHRSLPIRLAVAGLSAFALILVAQLARETSLQVRVLDTRGQPTAVRVRIEDSNGVRPKVSGAVAISETAIPVPKQAIAVMWGQQDRAQGYALQPDGSFYADGAFDLKIPAGKYTVTLSKGFEYLKQTETMDLKPAAAASREMRLRRWIDMPARGWYSADDHIHLHRSPADDRSITRWIAAEDIQVGNILEMGDFWATFFSQYSFGERGRYQESGRVLSPGQEEPRTSEIGHTISLGAREFVRMPRDYYSYDRLFDRVHALGGVTGFAHQGMSFHGYRGMALNTIRGKTDFLELAQFCVPEGPIATDHYYHFLDLGFKLTALAGSDFPWCGHGPDYGFKEPRFAQIGNARFYAYVDGAFSYEKFFDSVRAGHTFVTTGPMLFLTVNGLIPGGSLDAAPGSKLSITAEAFGVNGQVPLSSLEIVAHSKVIAKADAAGPAHLKVTLEVPAKHGIWIAAKAQAGTGQFAHTTPVYVTVGGDGFYDPETAARKVEISENYLKEIEQELANPGTNLDNQLSRHRAQMERQIAEARAKLKSLSFSR